MNWIELIELANQVWEFIIVGWNDSTRKTCIDGVETPPRARDKTSWILIVLGEEVYDSWWSVSTRKTGFPQFRKNERLVKSRRTSRKSSVEVCVKEPVESTEENRLKEQVVQIGR